MSTQRASRRKGTVTIGLSDADFAVAETLATSAGTTIQKWIADLVAARVVEERQKARAL